MSLKKLVTTLFGLCSDCRMLAACASPPHRRSGPGNPGACACHCRSRHCRAGSTHSYHSPSQSTRYLSYLVSQGWPGC